MTTFLPRLRDADAPPSPLSIDPSVLFGRWRNTETRWQWVREVEIRSGPRLRVRGGGGASPAEWGEVPVEMIYTTGPDSAEVGGFSATFELAGMTTVIQATLNQGLMVVVAFNDAHERELGSSRVTREFFAREENPS